MRNLPAGALRVILVPSCVAGLAKPLPAVAGDQLAGPVEARVVRIVDGDTFVAEARVWPGHSVTVSVRIRGIDAPEMQSGCESEKAFAEEARAALAALVGEGPVTLSRVGGGKFYGRVLADVATREGREVASYLLERSLARAYDGGKRASFC